LLVDRSYAARLRDNEELLGTLASAACNPSHMLRTYLKMDGDNDEYEYEYDDRNEDEDHISYNNASDDEVDGENEEHIGETAATITAIASCSGVNDSRAPLKNVVNMNLSDNTYKVCLVISEVTDSGYYKLMRRVMSPFMSSYVYEAPFGLFHVAFTVGDWLFEFNTSSICIPRKPHDSSAILSVELATISENDVKMVASRLADLICYVNANIEYTTGKGDMETTLNSHQFVDLALDYIGLDTSAITDDKKSSLVAKFINKMKRRGSSEIIFEYDASFRERFKLAKYSSSNHVIKFNSHAELDTFMLHLLEIDPEFERNYHKEWELLDAFDRAMWMRYKRHMSNYENNPSQDNMTLMKKYAPAMRELSPCDEDNDEYYSSACPF